MELTGAFTFLSTVDYLWANGVVVLPLADPGAFHGAYWRIDDRDVIILKQSNRSPARWHFDLLHEYYHLLATEDSSRMVLDDDQSELGLADADEEEEANQFAGSALLAGRAEELTAEAVSTAGGRMERLKSAVSSVAQRREIDLAALANYVAWRLSLQGENWWAAASSLQPSAPDPWEVARDSLLLQLDLQGLDDLDRSILIRAIQEVGG
jgi:Zn-dependent peptidase ImmA (M78 family)